jgi:spermidine synthase
VLLHEKSEFQDVLVFQSKQYGKVLVLDGVIQVHVATALTSFNSFQLYISFMSHESLAAMALVMALTPTACTVLAVTVLAVTSLNCWN